MSDHCNISLSYRNVELLVKMKTSQTHHTFEVSE